MSNSEFANLPPNLSNIVVEKSKITKTNKKIIGIFLAVLVSLITLVVIYVLTIPIPHNSLIINGYRGQLIGHSSIHYVFSINKFFNINIFRKVRTILPTNLGEETEWSPDGQWIVSSVRDTDDLRIYIMRADGGQRTLIPFPSESTWRRSPTWSPNGKEIAFAATGWGEGIFIANVECVLLGASCIPESRLLIKPSAGYIASSPDWSPDGSQIIYGERGEIFKMDVDGQSPPINLFLGFSGAMGQPKWSPDGTKIVTVCTDRVSVVNICVIDRDGSNLTYLLPNEATKRIYHPTWSPDGKKIAFISEFSDKPIFGFCYPNGCPRPTSVFIVNADGSGIITHLPFDNNVVIGSFTWYP